MKRQGRALIGTVFLGLASAVGGCDDGAPAQPTAPLAAAPRTPAPVRMLTFIDPISGVQTSDVHDVHGQIVRLDTADTLLWVADRTEFAGFPMASGYEKGSMEVLWGIDKGERRAYLTFSTNYWHYPPPASLVDLEVFGGQLVIRHPEPPVPLPSPPAIEPLVSAIRNRP